MQPSHGWTWGSGDVAAQADRLAFDDHTAVALLVAPVAIVYDENTRTLSVDLTNIDTRENEGALLLDQLVSSENVYSLTLRAS